LLTVTGNTSKFVAVNADSHDFGTVNQGGTSAPFGFTVINAGVDDLSVSDISIGGTGLADFAFDGAAPGAATLGSGESLSAPVVFAPQSGGAKSVTLTVASNDTENGDQSVELSGEARSIPALVFPGNGLTDVSTEVTFIWKTPYAPEGETVTENFYLATDEAFTGVTPVDVSLFERPEFYLAGFGLISSFGLAGAFLSRWKKEKGRREGNIVRFLPLLILALLFLFLYACEPAAGPDAGGDESFYTVSDLEPSTTYYWKVEAAYSSGDSLTSEAFSFTTQ
jgi:hypothetical protein